LLWLFALLLLLFIWLLLLRLVVVADDNDVAAVRFESTTDGADDVHDIDIDDDDDDDDDEMVDASSVALDSVRLTVFVSNRMSLCWFVRFKICCCVAWNCIELLSGKVRKSRVNRALT
jgi:hypothetical protein